MQTTEFKAWLEQRGLVKASVNTIASDAKRVEKIYDDLDELYTHDRFAEVLQELSYSKNDEQSDALNPSRIKIDGNLYNSLSTYRTALTRYLEYRDANLDDNDLTPGEPDNDDGQARLFGLERDLQAALRSSIKQLDPGLTVTDGGIERSVASGFIDITARDADGNVVVIELKAGTARRDAVAQILSYMGDIATEKANDVRGILVAGEFDKKARSAASMVPALSLQSYRVKFEFESVDDAKH